MRIIAIGGRAEGVIAIGQEATGFFALGQFATGVIAIGQVARGVIAIGQLAIGIFAVGQLALGLTFCLAMLGAGGRTVGIVLPIVPVPPRKKKIPPLGSLSDVGRKGSGWVRAELAKGSGTTILADIGGQRVPLEVGADLFLAAYYFAKREGGSAEPLFLELASSGGETYRLRQIKRAVDDRSGKPWFGAWSVAQLVLLAIAAWGYLQFVVVDLIDFMVRLTQDAVVNGISVM